MNTNIDCQEVTDSILTARHDASRDPALAAHLAGCPRCASLAEIATRVGAVSRTPIDVAPGFPSRMIAGATTRLQRRRHRRMAARASLASAAVAAAALLIVWVPGPAPARLALDESPNLGDYIHGDKGEDPLAAALRTERDMTVDADEPKRSSNWSSPTTIASTTSS